MVALRTSEAPKAISPTPRIDTSAVPLSSSISRLVHGGTISGHACGRTIFHSCCAGEKPSAMPASRCAGATAATAPRTTSEPYAPYVRPSVRTAAHIGASCQPKPTGSTKNIQNIRISADVPRKISK